MSCLPVSVSLSDSAMRPDADSAHKKTLLLCRLSVCQAYKGTVFLCMSKIKSGKKLIISIAFCGNKKKFVSLPYYIANSIIIHSYELQISNHIYLNYY